MTDEISKPDTQKILAGLKDFQLATVEHVFHRLYADADSTRRFLVADEVGLGKTLVARGVIAKSIDHLWDQVDRIDIVYVCSNTDIARQNINRLNVCGCNEFAMASRITLMPLRKLDGGPSAQDIESQRVNFVSFTPGTSFDLKNNSGIARERALLFWMLHDAWELYKPIHSRPFEGNSKRKGFGYELDRVNPQNELFQIHAAMQREFVEAVGKNPGLREEYLSLLEKMPPRKNLPRELSLECLKLIGELRRLLAEVCLKWLEPDLIILDEFQRFKHLMAGKANDPGEAAILAEHLFDYQDDTTAARVLLLSATPYKMYTTNAESDEDDHYRDFRLTLSFLVQDESKRNRFEILLEQYRDELFHVADHGVGRLKQAKGRLEEFLSQVMVRTERLAADDERNGMLEHKPMQGVELQDSDVEQYVALQDIAEKVGHGEMLEYWKSAPYLMNFMENYDVKRKLANEMEEQTNSSLVKAFRKLGDGLLERRKIESYGKVDPSNARLRSLAADTVGRHAWKLLWIPPSLPYYKGGGAYGKTELKAFTKRLVFSNWKVVPKAIASVLSYESERRMMKQYRATAKNDTATRESFSQLLQFRTNKDGKAGAMTTLALLYPCQTLAENIDPRRFLGGETTAESAIAQTEKTVSKLLEPIMEKHRSNSASQASDLNWYWAAQLLLDQHYHSSELEDWLATEDLATRWSEASTKDKEASKGWRVHVQEFSSLNAGDLGPPPRNLNRVLAEIALGSPGVVSRRAVMRVVHRSSSDTSALVANYAGPIASSFLTLFNLQEVTSLLRDPEDIVPYWQRVVRYAVHGNLQAVLDEYVHVLVESLGLPGQPRVKFLEHLTREVIDAITLRTTRSQADVFDCEGRRLLLEPDPMRLRNRFAVAFGEHVREESDEKTRLSQVRCAFNSPFWPFVLASTSVGQEGLDFHPYCHAIVHWNLPSNPVDLEQREGRIHRYKGHALRKNTAESFSQVAQDSDFSDPWEAMFERAQAERADDQSDLYPFWVSPNGSSKIERHVPLIPHSREVVQQQDLQKSLVLYRMVFGQNRQEDLIRYLQSRFSPEQIAELTEVCRIDLSPSQHDAKA